MSGNAKSATLTFNPHNQNLDQIKKVVESVLGRAGCGTCGRIAFLKVDFLGDPADLKNQGVISAITEGF
jgi:hypothetical protein